MKIFWPKRGHVTETQDIRMLKLRNLQMLALYLGHLNQTGKHRPGKYFG